jgi:hypothetical protein
MRLGCTHDLSGSVSVTFGGRELLTYVYAPRDAQVESPRPYVHPMRTLAGHLVTVYRPHDHVWHKGLSWSLPHMGPDNFWGGPTYAHGPGYVQRDNNGSMQHRSLRELSADGDRVRVRHDLAWRTQGGRHLVDEDRALTVTVSAGDGAWVLRFDTAMTNVSGATIMIGSPTTAGRENAGYGGLFWRGPRSFTGGVVLSPDGPGGDELRGVRAPWMGFTGRHDEVDASSTLVAVDSPSNPRHPPQWFVRSEHFGGLCPAPFFSEELPFAAGETLRFSYAYVIADGAADADRLAALGAAG